VPVLCNVEGKLVPPDQAVVPVLDRGFLYGDSVYEVVRTYSGRPFELDRHLARMEKTALRIDLTLPPRENGGNFDAKQLTKGSKLLLPVAVEGALFSTGDGHFAQGDGEVCVTAVEMGATVAVRFRVLKAAAGARAMRAPRFSHAGYFAPPEWAAPRGFIAAMGMPIREDGVNEGENLTLACRNALLNMIDLLQERGWSREQAYVICSVAADLRISNVVDVPNYVVSALLPEAIFAG